MRQKVLAFDYDGTIAEDGKLPQAIVEALQQLHLEGCALFLVTGRKYASVDLGSLRGLFRGVVWENGAVLDPPGTGEVYLPFGYLEPRLWNALESARVELEHGPRRFRCLDQKRVGG